MKKIRRVDSNSGIIFILVLAIIGIWLFQHPYKKLSHASTEPFWRGTADLTVCKPPFANTKECQKLKVSLIDSKTAKIYFRDGKHKISCNIECEYKINFHTFSRYPFCRSWDEKSEEWDLLPPDVEN